MFVLAHLVHVCFFFYLGWWLQHEEDLGYGSEHTHPGAPHYWKGAVPFAALWVVLVTARYHIVHLPTVLLLVTASSLLTTMRTEFHPDGVPIVPALVAAVAAAATGCVTAYCLPRRDGLSSVAWRSTISTFGWVVDATFFFYLAWWMGHEHHAVKERVHDHDHTHRASDTAYESFLREAHPLAPHYWKIGVPFVVLWLWTLLVVHAPVYVWARPLVAVLATVSLALLAAVRLPYHPEGLPPEVVLPLAFVAWLLVVMTAPAVLVRVRLGRVRLVTPTTRRGLVLAAQRGAVPVGNGWSFWLQYARAPSSTGLVRVADNWSGLEEVRETTVRVRSGTTFGVLRRLLSGHGRALADVPLFDDVTLGAAVVTGAHGWNAHTSFVDTVVRVETVDRAGVITTSRNMLHTGQVVVLSVTLRTVSNDAFRVVRRSLRHFDEVWNEATYRMATVCASGVTLVTATPSSEDEKPHLMSPRCDNLGALCPTVGTLCDREVVRRRSRLHTPFVSMWPLEMLSMRALRYRNAGVFLHDTPARAVLVATLRRYHGVHGGHTTLRQTGRVLILDMAVPWWWGRAIPNYWKALHSAGVRHVSLHPGKWQPSTVAPLTLMLSV